MSMIPVTTVFKALSDPVRVEMVQRLSQGHMFSLGSISNDLGITRQGARKHLVILENAEIIYLHKNGRTTEVKLNPDSLDVVKKFISQLERQWDKRLLALREYVEKKENRK